MSDVRTCGNCKSVYHVYKYSASQRDEDTEYCEVCGEELFSWRGAYYYVLKLVEKREEHLPKVIVVDAEELEDEEENRRCECGEDDPDIDYYEYPIGEEDGEIKTSVKCERCYNEMNGYGHD